MLPVFVFRFLLFSQLGQLLSAGKGNGNQGKCPSLFNCGFLGMVQFPFTTTERPDCGILDIAGCDGPEPNSLKTVKLNGKFPYVVLHVGRSSLIVQDLVLHNLLRSKNCDVFSSNFTFPSNSPLASYISLNVTLYRCNRTLNVSPPSNHFLKYSCPDNIDIYYDPHPSSSEKTDGSLSACSMVQLPSKDFPDNSDPFTFVSSEIFLQVELSDDCDECYHQKGGHCQLDNDKKFHCTCTEERRSLALKLGLGLGLPAIVIGLLVGLVYKRKNASSNVQFHSRDTYSDPYSDESSSAYYGIPVFSYKELEEATNNFDRTRELGDGGFGTVYYGKLQDGREVAVKHLYEHNYRRVQQFMNEVKILTHLRHKNLVSLYGCTSRQSRELLLVYEYIPNGTVACHLHGDLAKPGLMPWHVRMKIAIETASALVYLHASDIIHRDVKTSNILLDNSFCVKVADFGLSRMFPSDVTHVSTAPQGTPGYVDPEYYRCYQLTSKSDVYSFGVVLIELISSMPAVDMSRHNDEINLADLAVKKIQKSAFSELVDPSLGFESDNDVKRMLVLVAELAFQCLQREKELRPSMDEVLEALKSIESGEDEPDHQDEADVQDAGTLHSNIHPVPPSSPEEDEVGLLNKLKPPRSPNSVTDNWESKSTTPNVSG